MALPATGSGSTSVGLGEAGYPSWLASIPSPPPTLWFRGRLPDTAGVAVVGTRRPDADGRRLAKAIGVELAGRGWPVISGLAEGIDTCAHRGALDAGGPTWAVVGCGVDRARAVEDPRLADDIVAGGGGLIAEVPDGTLTSSRALVARDRIQSGLSEAVVVVQTDLGSGTMHTARFTVMQSRLLAVIAPLSAAAVWAGNAAIGSAEGCPPSVLHATGAAARAIGERRPLADVILPASGDLAALLELIGSPQPRPGP